MQLEHVIAEYSRQVWVKNDIWRNIDSSIRLLAENCIIYGEITDINHIGNLQKDLNTLGNGRWRKGLK